MHRSRCISGTLVRLVPLVGRQYAPHTLSDSLPRLLSVGHAAAPPNVTTAHDLLPISAALIAYNLIIAYQNGRDELPMSEKSADVARKINQSGEIDRKFTGTALDSCYGQIGISAVAAAARYQGGAKNPAYAPASSQWQDRIAESAT